ncbi:MAG: hypothetical protein KatS3mg124_0521 [Porticoccaceae bacterium]|nr:MAG: hypothetical protein KatS3mg124_0521 [Porticoccaceae bacterium]
MLCVTALVSALGQLALGFARGLPLAVAPATVLDHLLIAAIPAGLLLHHLYLQQLVRVKERAELESRIQALQARIRPHFLFNSMNIIASLIGSDPERAETVVEDLSDLFRHALADNHHPGPPCGRSSTSAGATWPSSSCASASGCAAGGKWVTTAPTC